METYVDAIGVDTEATTTMAKQSKKKLKVMVAMDESKNSFYALEWAVEHLRDVISAEPETDQAGGLLTLVHVHPTYLQYIYPSGGTASAVYATDSVPESMKKAREESTAKLFTRSLEICRGKMVKTETMILEGDPKEMICQAVEQTHVDLLVVGSRGLGMIKRAFLGSVSDYCAQHAKCPILIVRPPRETSTSSSTKEHKSN
ncbi:Adenine nucleotide alpha hydrolases-like superfamily protein [Raphanus sativus]|uniref:Universal stress protein A-like protein isoform X1 n=1 Tax=Raphanus sativus TaxID=3726 RepID=A0A6J0K6M2_RAPSA|nr:universal stress protein A-like protein isoform X1 [Raphanus sativus]KAJ4885037.1 Adenine nucleotide alpha hydrolases-like superfamily protein [Raphanus sativus]